MKRLITVEEHYVSTSVIEKLKDIYEKYGTEEEKKSIPMLSGVSAPGVTDLGADRIAYMDAHGIDAQVISTSGIPASLKPEYAIPLCQDLNNEMAEKTKKYPGRFYNFAHLPIGDAEAAAQELERCVKDLGFVGAMISSHYNGLPYDDPHYLPIFEKAAELDVPIYLHPGFVSPEINKQYYQGSWSKETAFMFAGFGIGWHYDVGDQILRMMLSGLFDKLPNLKIMCGHWGEVVAYFMYRMDEIPQKLTKLNKKISDYFKENIFVNPSGMLYGEQFRFCLETFGPDHIMWGEDYPYRDKKDIRTFLENFDLSDEDKEKIAHGNVERIMHIK